MMIFFQVIGIKAYATHSAGADISYRCLGGLQYELTVTFYRDCGGVAEPASIQVSCKSVSGSYNFYATANKIALTGEEISLPCSTAFTSCNGGSTTGLRKFIYKVVVTLPSAEPDWVFSYSLCCRNCSITTITNPCANISTLYIEATLNNTIVLCNNSPSFSNIPITFVSIGQNFNFNHGAIDTDGDSLSYSLITPRTSASSYVNYIAPHNTLNPIISSTPFILNSLTGDINFTPVQTEIGILTVLVKEYRNGQLIGSVIRDMQIYTHPSQNNLPIASGINGTNNHNVTLCPGQQICFTVSTMDLDSSQMVSLTTNYGISNATYNIINSPHPTLEFCWTPSINDVSSSPKTFTVTVTDDACPTKGAQTFSFNIFVHGPKFNITTTNISCNQLSDGSASITTLTANNLLYTWSNGATTQSISGLVAGNYSVIATDSSGCSASKTVTINPSVSIRIDTIQITPLKCFQDTTGNINLTISGGIPPYNYLWSNGSTSASLYNIVAGTYSLTIKDSHQCLTDTSIIINQPGTKLENTFVIEDVLCFGENSGAIQTQVTGGTLPYSYEWNNGTTHYFLDNVAAGNYIVSVSDSNGCVLIDSAFVNQPAEDLHVILETENITCYGDANGSLNLSVTGGTAGYTYQWSNGSITQNLSHLQSGYYSVIVNDANGCNIMATSFITQPTYPLQMSALKKDVTCNGLNNGSIDLYIEGGTPIYMILWNTGDTTISLNNLSSGKYTTTLTDANGCTAISQSHITEPPLLQTILTTINANCFLSQTGSISLTTAGGIQPYFYLWSNGDTTQNLLHLSVGKYEVTVTDKNNCLINAFASISDTTLFDIIISGDSIICVGDKATLMAPFYSDVQYQWYFNDMILNGANANTFISPAAGSYKLLTKFSCGIDTSNSILVTVRASDLISISNNFIICPGESVQLLAGGGVDYLWTPQNGLNEVNIPNPVASPLRTTNYSVFMHDEYGCSSEGNVQIAVVCDTLDVPNGFSPNGDGVNDYYVIDGISHYSENVLFVYNRWGNLVYKKSGYDNSWDGTSNVKGIGFGKILLDGTYFFILNFSDNTKPVSSYLFLKR